MLITGFRSHFITYVIIITIKNVHCCGNDVDSLIEFIYNFKEIPIEPEPIKCITQIHTHERPLSLVYAMSITKKSSKGR